MSLHIQAPKKDPDYEEEDNNMGLCLFDNDLGDLWPLTHLKKPHSWCVQLLSEKYIYFKIHKLQMLYMNVLLNLQVFF